MARITWIAVLVFLSIVNSCFATKNVLFIAVDDLRPELNSYGATYMHTPNFDRLANMSLQFNRAYTQQAVCGPSRASLLTGRRPDTTRVYVGQTYWRTDTANFTTLPQFFKENGYETVGAGKIFHPGHDNDPISWNNRYYESSSRFYKDRQPSTSWEAFPESVTDVNILDDTANTEHILRKIKQFKRSGKQFFAALGFLKPHLPFIFPEKFLDYYPDGTVSEAMNPTAPYNMPADAWNRCNELRSFDDIDFSAQINVSLPIDKQIELRRAYYAAVSYIDSLLGEVLDLYEERLQDDTILVLWGDHGWQLGEHGLWCKQTNFELATRVPLFIHDPDMPEESKGAQTEALTELVDIFPSILELAGFSVDECADDSTDQLVCTEGTSFVPLMQDASIVNWKTAAFSQFRRTDVMGYSMVDYSYRYTEWIGYNFTSFEPDWLDIRGVELYDHINDPDENINLAYETDQQIVDTRGDYSARLRAGWKSSVP